MIYKALASAIMGAVLSSSKKHVMETVKSQVLRSHMEGARQAMLAHVAEKYTEEAEYNFSQYIRALGQANIEVEYKGKPGEALVMRAESAIRELEGYLEPRRRCDPVSQETLQGGGCKDHHGEALRRAPCQSQGPGRLRGSQ